MRNFILLFLSVLSLYAFAQNPLDNPESIVYDYENSRYLVSSLGNRKIYSIDEDGNIALFKENFGQTYGIHLRGDRLYVSSGSVLRSFFLENGAEVMSLHIPAEVNLDGITSDDHGFIYVLDTGGSLHKVDPKTETYETLIDDGIEGLPQDLVYDRFNNRLLIAAWQANSPIMGYDLDTQMLYEVVDTDYGRFDGINIDYEGNVYASTWITQEVLMWDNAFSEDPKVIGTGMDGPTGLCYNARDHVIAVPNFDGNFIKYIDLKSLFNFEQEVLIDNLTGANNLCLADVDLDGQQDIVAAGTDQVHYWLADGAGGFGGDVFPGSFPGTCFVSAFDMDNDTDEDVLFCCMESGKLGWIEIGEAFTEHVIDDDMVHVRSLDAGDMDDDGDVDVVCGIGDETGGMIALYENTGGMVFADPVAIPDADDVYHSVCFFNKDNDTDLDILAVGYTDQGVRWWENLGNGDFDDSGIDSSFEGATCVAAAEINQSGFPDVVAASWEDSRVKMWRQSNGNFYQNPIENNAPGARWVQPVDFDQDGHMDIVGCGDAPGCIYWWKKGVELDFTGYRYEFTGSRCVAAGHFDEDERMDMAVIGESSLAWLKNVPGAHPVIAEFDAYIIYGARMATFHFIDRSCGENLSYAWDFNNDGAVDSGERNPYFTYEAYGEYTVSLTVSNGEESHTLTLEDFIVYDHTGADCDDTARVPLTMDAYPNPFNPRVSFQIKRSPADRDLRVDIYNAKGQKVQSIAVPEKSEVVNWDATGVASGIYYCRLCAADRVVQTRKITLMK